MDSCYRVTRNMLFIVAVVFLTSLRFENATAFSRPLPKSTTQGILRNYSSNPSHSFSRSHHYTENRKPSLSILKANSDDLSDSSFSKRIASLHFKGAKIYKSEPVPILHDTTATASSNNDILSFFQKDEILPLILNGEREDCVELLDNKNVNEALLDQWTKQARIVGANTPSMSSGDDVFQVQTGNMNVYGLKIKSNSLIGVKYVDKDELASSKSNDGGRPEYELVFIKNKQFAEGPKFLVWIFNQLTGKTNSKKDKEKEQTVHSLSKFTYETTPDGESIIFTIEASLEIVVKFPSFLLKILPVSKEKAEEQGSASVLKTMGKDIEAVLPKIRDYYISKY